MHIILLTFSIFHNLVYNKSFKNIKDSIDCSSLSIEEDHLLLYPVNHSFICNCVFFDGCFMPIVTLNCRLPVEQ